MFSNRLINLGAFALMIYCFTQFRSDYYPDGIKLPVSAQSTPSKYKVDWDLDEENSKTSTTARIAHYLLSTKIREKAQGRSSILIEGNSLSNAVAIGDTVSIVYTIINNNQAEPSKELPDFLLSANAPLSNVIVGMSVGAEKTIPLKKDSREAALFSIENDSSSVKIKIKSLSKPAA